MNTLHVSYANSGDAWGIEDGTPPKTWYFRSSGEVNDYVESHGCIIQYHDSASFAKVRTHFFANGLLAWTPMADWPLWDAEHPPDGIGPDGTWLDGYGPVDDDDGNPVGGEGLPAKVIELLRKK